ncbi:hypothetical protein [Homoserinibacter sp. GY 40078]|uniref:hypothetical protein n=1 Tax=Homoserinibacter sp. GY 40078 TaxID=2603275 RepID=UPI0011C72C62|nr:hypothetical protein [Homoserinibacter sp. GY 40078]TXK19118.1 hypothetical protein FVQ89_04130 [Homoserinibacter sp. GY 40078]
MIDPNDRSFSDPNEDPQRADADDNRAGSPFGAIGSSFKSKGVPSGAVTLRFYAYERVVVRTVEVPAALRGQERQAFIDHALGVSDWREVEWEMSGHWGPTWGEPSDRALRMERDEPKLYRALKALRDRHWHFPFGPSESDH